MSGVGNRKEYLKWPRNIWNNQNLRYILPLSRCLKKYLKKYLKILKICESYPTPRLRTILYPVRWVWRQRKLACVRPSGLDRVISTPLELAPHFNSNSTVKPTSTKAKVAPGPAITNQPNLGVLDLSIQINLLYWELDICWCGLVIWSTRFGGFFGFLISQFLVRRLKWTGVSFDIFPNLTFSLNHGCRINFRFLISRQTLL